MEERDWADQIRDLNGATDRASAAAWHVAAWASEHVVADDVLPREMPEPLASHLGALHRELDRISELAQALFQRLCSDPTAKLLAGRPLSWEEYYLCRAMGADLGGAQELGLTELADYEVYRMLSYEDDRRFCYINVHLAPRDPQAQRVAARFGHPPEACRRRYLRPEQLAFFRDRLPDIYRRFSDD